MKTKKKRKTSTQRTKGASATPYIHASTRVMEGFGQLGAKARPFNADLAMRMFHSWGYAAAKLNANAVSQVPLRLYTGRPEGLKSSYEFNTKAAWMTAAMDGKALYYQTRRISDSTKRYLCGRGENKPSRSVVAKAIRYGMDIEEVVEPHPILQVLQTVNPWMNGYELTVLRMIDLQVCGNSYLYKVNDRLGAVSELWRMPPQWTRVIPDKDTFIKGYAYGWHDSPPNLDEFAADEVIHFKEPNPRDIHYGMGWFEAAWSALGLHQSKRTMDLAKFDNMARPDWLLSVNSPVQKDTLNTLEAKINEKLRGPDKKGKFLTVQGDVKATALQWEVDEIGTATRVIEEIAACSGVPVAMLLTNDPNRAGSDAARTSWYRNAVKPLALNDEEKLNERYVPDFDPSGALMLCYDHVSFEDAEKQGKLLVGFVAGGILTANEARAELGYSEAQGADYLNLPSGSTGGAAAMAGDMAVNQNDDRVAGRGEGKAMVKGIAMAAPAAPAGPSQEETELQFQRDTLLAFMKDKTAAGIITNITDLKELAAGVGLPGNKNAQPPIPVIAQDGPIVNGKPITDAAGNVIGGHVDILPSEVITIDQTGNKPKKGEAEINSESTPKIDTETSV